MDCCICSPMASIYRPPRNTICPSCYEGGRGMIAFLNELDRDQSLNDPVYSHGLMPNSSKVFQGISDAFKKMKDMKEMEERVNERLGFLSGILSALNESTHTDILVKPGTGPAIPAHRAVLATRSEIFKTMLESDECKAPAEDTISLPELSYEELQCLLEFLYSGNLPDDRAEKHAHSLLIAADKYDIPFLEKFCEQRILVSLDQLNVLDVLEVSAVCSNRLLKEHAMNSIVKHAEDVVFSEKFDAFALKNGHICVEITRKLLMEMKDRKESHLNV